MITKIISTAVRSSVLGWKRPTHLILHVTSSCNSRCGMCFAWKRLNKERDLTLEEIEKIAKSIPGLIFLDISGGEPFLRKDLDRILSVFAMYSPSAYVNLPTNGLLPEKVTAVTEKILDKCPLPISLNISLDGLEETHDYIRGVKGGFKRTLQTYSKLAVIKKKNPRLSLKVSTVVSNKNFKQLPEFAEFVKTKMKEVDFHTLILMRGDPRNRDFALPPLDEIKDKENIFLGIWEKHNYGKNLGSLGDRVANTAHRYFLSQYLKTLKQQKMSIPCLAGQAHAVIFSNGDVACCELRKPIGNLRDYGFNFTEIWASPDAAKQRKLIAKDDCYCAHGCNWTDNVFFNPQTYPGLTKELLLNIFQR